MKKLSFRTFIHKIGRKRILTLILLIIITGGVVAVYNINWWKTIISGISIENITPFLEHDGRYFTIEVKASGNVGVDIGDIYINQTKIVTYTLDRSHLEPNG